jgi:ABC-type sulfate/molybdate transport systems ATPase subunit
LSRRRIVGESGGVGGPALGEDLPLHLLNLPFEAVDALLRRRLRLTLCECHRRNQSDRGTAHESGDQTRFHEHFPTLSYSRL